jgi:metal-responsive CopG/Arc/MetJ family transcriptional regulator
MRDADAPAAKRGRGRPPVGTRVHVHLPPDLLTEIDRRAATGQVTRADIIRGLLAAALRT